MPQTANTTVTGPRKKRDNHRWPRFSKDEPGRQGSSVWRPRQSGAASRWGGYGAPPVQGASITLVQSNSPRHARPGTGRL